MATFHRPAQLMQHIQKRADTHVRSMRDVHRELWRGGIQDHAQLTSGRVTSDELRQMGHPFGRQTSGDRSTGVRGIQGDASRFATAGRTVTTSRIVRSKKWGERKVTKTRSTQIRKGVVLPLPINKQTGALRRSFFASAEMGPSREVRMGFGVEYAGYVLSPNGTKYMTARGFYSSRNGTQSLAEMGEVARRHRSRRSGLIAWARKRTLFY
jgi:hypothetical protein